MTEHEDLHGSDTVPLPVVEEPRKAPKPPNATQLLADGLDWLQYDMSQHSESTIAFFTRILIAQGEVREHIGYVRHTLVAIAVLLLINAMGLAVIIHLLGLLMGHVR